MILNGEIYNFRAVRSELEARGTACGRSDTEAIVHAYEERGVRCVERLHGMFAFALWDETERLLLLARDRVGKKPLYYAGDGVRLWFASELKALLQVDELKPRLNPMALTDYLSFGAVAAPTTIFEGVAQLPPAHYLTWQRGGRGSVSTGTCLAAAWFIATRRLPWRRSTRSQRGGPGPAGQRRPAGGFLSGGIDSSAVVEKMARLSDRPVVTTSVGFAEAGFSEIGHARTVARAVGSDHHEIMVTPRAAEVLPRLVWHLESRSPTRPRCRRTTCPRRPANG